MKKKDDDLFPDMNFEEEGFDCFDEDDTEESNQELEDSDIEEPLDVPKIRMMDLPPSQRPDKILNNNFNKVDYGTEATVGADIRIDPMVEEIYEESTTGDIMGVYEKKQLYKDMYDIFIDSSWYVKYGGDIKKTDKNDIPGLYFYFKDRLEKKNLYNSVQIFCTIAEFFDINYSILYNDVLTIKDKSEILGILEDDFSLNKKYLHSKKLF